MDEENDPNDVIDTAIQALAPLVSDEGAICTGWVLVSQWSGVDGSLSMGYQASDNLPTWTQRGLLAEGLHDLGER